MNTGINLYRSNNVQFLGAVYAELIRTHEDPNPLTTIDTVVGTPAMGKWLEKCVLSTSGVVAHHRFLFPRDMLFERLRMCTGKAPKAESTPWTPDRLCWTVSTVLDRLKNSADFRPIMDHLLPIAGAEPAGSQGWLQLVLKITRLFDNYLWYRHEWILNWESGGSLGAEQPINQWQPKLWRAVCQEVRRQHPDSLHFPRLLQLARREHSCTFPPLYVFGVTRLPPSLLSALAELSRAGSIHLFVLNPSAQYWADLTKVLTPHKLKKLNEQQLQHLYTETLMERSEGHPLLRQWGNQGRTNLYLMESLLEGHQKADHHLFATLRANDPSEPSSALQQLKHDLCALQPPPISASDRYPLTHNDDSIQLHNCHNLHRQLETLKDTLYRLFDRHKHLQPRDVLVLSPRYEEVAQLVPAVFIDSATDLPGIPYSRIDIPLNALNPIADALLSLLQLVHSRLDHLSVMAFISKPVIRARFQLSTEHTDQLKGWIQQAQIRWGINADDRHHNDQPAFDDYTWEQGIERMVLGFAMHSGESSPFDLSPLDTIEGGDGYTLLRGAECIRSVLFFARSFEVPCSSVQWQERLKTAIQRLTLTEHAWQTRVVLEKIEASLPKESTDQWSCNAIKSLFVDRFSTQKSDRATHQNAITFGSLYPERNLPYNVIALVGMDDGVFPGSRQRESIDLMHQHPQPGDPHRAFENRYLLLEELLCAKEHLLIFYTGRDERTNKNTPAAPPIQELKDVLEQSFVSTQTEHCLEPFERLHPLHPFGRQAFQPQRFPLLASYEQAMCPVTQEAAEPFSAIAEAPETRQLMLSDLFRFLRHPVRYRHRKVHSLNLSTWIDEIETREPFTASDLTLEIGTEMLCGLSAQEDLDTIKKRVRARFALPLGNPGHFIIEANAEKLLNRFERELKKLPSPLPVLPQERSRHTLHFAGHPLLSFSLPPIDEHILFFQAARSKEQAQKRMWFEYCCGVASGIITDQRLFCLSLYPGDGPMLSSESTLPTLTQAEAQALIVHHLVVFQRGMTGQLLAYPKTGQYLVRKAAARRKGWSREELLSPPPEREKEYQHLLGQLYKKWRSSGGGRYSGDLDCPNIAFQFADPPPILEGDRLSPRFVEDSLAIWGAPFNLPVGDL